MSGRSLSIIVPAYNEERTMHRILDKVRIAVLEHRFTNELIIVNVVREPLRLRSRVAWLIVLSAVFVFLCGPAGQRLMAKHVSYDA